MFDGEKIALEEVGNGQKRPETHICLHPASRLHPTVVFAPVSAGLMRNRSKTRDLFHESMRRDDLHARLNEESQSAVRSDCIVSQPTERWHSVAQAAVAAKVAAELELAKEAKEEARAAKCDPSWGDCDVSLPALAPPHRCSFLRDLMFASVPSASHFRFCANGCCCSEKSSLVCSFVRRGPVHPVSLTRS